MKHRNDVYFRIAEGYKQLYLKSEGDSFLFQIGKFQAVRGVLVHVYAAMVWEKECLPIEKLDQEEKEKLWQEAKRISEQKNREYVIETAKALHGFGTFIQL